MGIAAAGIGAIGGAAKFFEGRKMQKQAQSAIDNFQWQDLKNPFENLQVSRLGADLQREEAGRTTATSVEALRSGGTRGIIGGLGRVNAQNNLLNRQIGADLDQQQKRIDFARAEDDTRIRSMQEQRQANELQGYGQAMSVGLGMKHDGIGNVMNAVGAIGQMGGSQGSGGAGGGAMGAGATNFGYSPNLPTGTGYQSGQTGMKF